MALTPVDILHTQFKVSYRGYTKAQVDEFVRAVTQSLEEALQEKSNLQRRVDALQDELDRIRKIESAMTDALTLAQRTADELKTTAHCQAQAILAEAEQERVRMTVEAQKEAERHLSEIRLLEASRERFDTEFRAMLQGYLDWLDRRAEREKLPAEVA